MKKCIHCQAVSQDDAVFCSKCGGSTFETCDVTVDENKTEIKIEDAEVDILEEKAEEIKENIAQPAVNETTDQFEAFVQPAVGEIVEPMTGQDNSIDNMPVVEDKSFTSTENGDPENADDTIKIPYRVTKENKLSVAFAWIPVLSWIIYLIKPNDEAVVKASNQGMLLLIANIIIYVLRKILGWAILNFDISMASVTIISVLNSVSYTLSIGTFALSVTGLVIALSQNRVFEIPGTQKLAIFKTKA